MHPGEGVWHPPIRRTFRGVGKHVAPRNSHSRPGRLAGSAAAAGVALCLVLAPLATPLSAYAVALSDGGGSEPSVPGVLQPAVGSAPIPPPAPVRVGGAATLDGRTIASLTWAQLGRGLDGPNTIDGGDYRDSSALPDAWCAAFAGWAWSEAGVSTAGLDGWAGSFLDYGRSNGTFHTGAPRVGDAAVFAMSEGVAQASANGTLTRSHLIEHVGIVVAVTSTTVTVVNGDWGDGHGGPHLVRVASYALAGADAPNYAPGMEQYIAGYVDPVGR